MQPIIDSIEKIAVLSIDGGPLTGLAQISIIDKLEVAAYQIGIEIDELCMPNFGDQGRIPVSDLYDYIVGTQTGALAASMLTLRDGENPMWTAAQVYDFVD